MLVSHPPPAPASFFVKLPQLPLYTLHMCTTYLYRSAPGVTFDCLCVNLLLHNKKISWQIVEVVSPAILVRLLKTIAACSIIHIPCAWL